MPLSENAFHYRLKAAVHDLITYCGGIEQAGSIAGYGKSTVHRWQDREGTDMPPLLAVVALERHCGRAFVSEVMAGVTGRELSEPVAHLSTQSDILVAHAHVRVSEASLGLAVAEAVADGVVTPAEVAHIDREAALLDRANGDLRAKIASIRARGGEASSLRVMGGAG